MPLSNRVARSIRGGVFSGLLFLLLASTVFGQAISTGTIQGALTDPSGAAVAGATVTLTDIATGSTRSADSNESGRYIFANISPSKYNVSVTKQGFRAIKVPEQELTVGAVLTLDLKLEIGSSTETIEVFAAGATMDTASATVGNTLTGIPLDNLPGLGRDVSTFVTLQPASLPTAASAVPTRIKTHSCSMAATTPATWTARKTPTHPASRAIPSGGLVNAQVTGTAPNGSPGGGGPTGVMPTPADSIEEFRVGTNNQTADFNGSAGAQVQLVTKRGTNQWHGTAYEYYLDNTWGANTFNNNASDSPKPSYHYNRFGGSAGGPIISKNVLGGKWFFFANYEGFRWPSSTTVTRIVPSAAMDQGILQFAGAAYNLNPTPVTYTGPSTSILTKGQVVAPPSAPPVRAIRKHSASAQPCKACSSTTCPLPTSRPALDSASATASTFSPSAPTCRCLGATTSASPVSTTTSAPSGTSTVHSVTTKWSAPPATRWTSAACCPATNSARPPPFPTVRNCRGISPPASPPTSLTL